MTDTLTVKEIALSVFSGIATIGIGYFARGAIDRWRTATLRRRINVYVNGVKLDRKKPAEVPPDSVCAYYEIRVQNRDKSGLDGVTVGVEWNPSDGFGVTDNRDVRGGSRTIRLLDGRSLAIIWEKPMLAGGEDYAGKLCVCGRSGPTYPNPMNVTIRVSNGRGATLKFPAAFIPPVD